MKSQRLKAFLIKIISKFTLEYQLWKREMKLLLTCVWRSKFEELNRRCTQRKFCWPNRRFGASLLDSHLISNWRRRSINLLSGISYWNSIRVVPRIFRPFLGTVFLCKKMVKLIYNRSLERRLFYERTIRTN